MIVVTHTHRTTRALCVWVKKGLGGKDGEEWWKGTPEIEVRWWWWWWQPKPAQRLPAVKTSHLMRMLWAGVGGEGRECGWTWSLERLKRVCGRERWSLGLCVWRRAWGEGFDERTASHLTSGSNIEKHANMRPRIWSHILPSEERLKRKEEEGMCVRGVPNAEGGGWKEGTENKDALFQPVENVEPTIHQMTRGPKVNKMGVCCPAAIYFYVVFIKKKSARETSKNNVRTRNGDSGRRACEGRMERIDGKGPQRQRWDGDVDGGKPYPSHGCLLHQSRSHVLRMLWAVWTVGWVERRREGNLINRCVVLDICHCAFGSHWRKATHSVSTNTSREGWQDKKGPIN